MAISGPGEVGRNWAGTKFKGVTEVFSFQCSGGLAWEEAVCWWVYSLESEQQTMHNVPVKDHWQHIRTATHYYINKLVAMTVFFTCKFQGTHTLNSNFGKIRVDIASGSNCAAQHGRTVHLSLHPTQS